MFSGPMIVLLLAVSILPVASGQRSTAVGTATPATVAPTSASATAAPTTDPTVKPSCASISYIGNHTWNASFANSNSDLYKDSEKVVSNAIKYLYNDSSKYVDVQVSHVKFSEKDSLTSVEAKLCLVVKTNEYIEDVFKAKVKTGYLHPDFPVKSDSAEYETLGVKFKDWKAKECDKCKGTAGEFEIVGTCEDETSSCKGQKKTKMSTDCATYCPSNAAAITVSFLILAIGVFLSFSFQ